MNGRDLGNINIENYSIVVMPDFFIDRIVSLHSINELFRIISGRVELRISNGKHGHTVAMEFENALHSKVNIMLNDVGDVANFGSSRIDDNDTRKILQNADGVMVVNWGSNLKGPELIEYAFENSPQAIHFIDPADIESRKNEFKDYAGFAYKWKQSKC